MNFSGLDAGGMLHSQGGGSGLINAQNDGLMTAFPAGDMFGQQQQHQQGEYLAVKSLMVDGGDRFSVSAVAFDTQEELLWMGNHGGHVTSYYGLDLQKYTSFQVHETQEVRQMLSLESQLLCLTPDSLRCWSKYGRPQFHHESESLVDMQCMLQTRPGVLLLGGHQPLMVEFDIETKTEIRQVEVNEPGCAILRFSNSFVCAGDTSGKLTLRDPKTLESEHVLKAHSGTLSDFDVHGNQLVTCGFSNRMGNLTVDRFLMVYDLRFLKAQTPLQMSLEPAFLRFVPSYSNRVCVVSQSGQFQLMEQGAMTPSSMIMYQVHTEGAAIASFDISPTCNLLAFGDAGGFLHSFATGEHPVINAFSTQTEFPSMEPLEHHISFNDDITPFAIIPVSYPTSGKLLSDWPDDCCKRLYRKPQRIEQEVLRTMKLVQNVGYAPNPGTRRRNQAPYKVTTKAHERKSSVPDSPLERGEDPFVMVPKRYRKVEIKYSKLGVEDFDFRHYNKTNFPGLETHIPNAYCNAMLQVLYFIEPMRCSLLNHLCDKEFCLACELSFLFHMLEMETNKTCQIFTRQATNFLRAFRTIPEASALGLVLNDAEESMGKVNLPRLIQNWNRFILQQVHSELLEASREDRESSPQRAMKEATPPVLEEQWSVEGEDVLGVDLSLTLPEPHASKLRDNTQDHGADKGTSLGQSEDGIAIQHKFTAPLSLEEAINNALSGVELTPPSGLPDMTPASSAATDPASLEDYSPLSEVPDPKDLEATTPNGLEEANPTSVEDDSPTGLEGDNPTGLEDATPTNLEHDRSTALEDTNPTSLEDVAQTGLEHATPISLEDATPAEMEATPSSLEDTTRSGLEDSAPSDVKATTNSSLEMTVSSGLEPTAPSSSETTAPSDMEGTAALGLETTDGPSSVGTEALSAASHAVTDEAVAQEADEAEKDSQDPADVLHTQDPADVWGTEAPADTPGTQVTEDSTDEDGDDPPSSAKLQDTVIKKFFGYDLENTFTCCKCGEIMNRAMTASVTDINYPDLTNLNTPGGATVKKVAFCEVIQRSLCLEQNTQAWCSKCQKYQPHVQAKKLKSLPDVLALNCHLENIRDLDFWRMQEEFFPKKSAISPPVGTKLCRYGNLCTRTDCKFRHEADNDMSLEQDPMQELSQLANDEASITSASWVPIGLRIKLTPDGKIQVINLDEEDQIPESWEEKDTVFYQLHATVSYVRDSKSGGNLVSHVKVGSSYHQRKEKVTCTQWYLFNDFAIMPIEWQEAVHFSLDWKLPCVIYFMRNDMHSRYHIPVENPIVSDVLFANASLVTPRRKHVTFVPLDDGELPQKNDIIGIDAEFVTLNQEEAELRSDGTRSTIKPSQMSVARITCIRGKGPLQGEPFIDDYISTSEQVVDYLTQFSGIQPGDLDAAISSKHLTTLKSTYLKLRYLVDTGVIFVGHGLKKDFRVINLVVPKHQVIDTVELFQLPRQRMISLKFLAWYFLGINIQSAMHDSIEDARTALKLYYKYQELSKDGMDAVRTAIKEMYEKGRKMQWKIPDVEEELETLMGEEAQTAEQLSETTPDD